MKTIENEPPAFINCSRPNFGGFGSDAAEKQIFSRIFVNPFNIFRKSTFVCSPQEVDSNLLSFLVRSKSLNCGRWTISSLVQYKLWSQLRKYTVKKTLSNMKKKRHTKRTLYSFRWNLQYQNQSKSVRLHHFAYLVQIEFDSIKFNSVRNCTMERDDCLLSIQYIF